MHATPFVSRSLSALAVFALPLALSAQTPTPGQNVNMVSGRDWPGGDAFLQRQNEPSIAVSTRNPLHLMAGANDYRTVDLPLTDELPNGGTLTGDAWLGLFKSFNGGQTWQSTLIPGYPQDLTANGLGSPLKGFTTASDPVVRSGTNGLFYYGGIAFDRATSQGAVFVSRFIDLNNRENGNAAPAGPVADSRDPIRYNGTVVVDRAGVSQFLDKPWLAVDVPRPGAATCHLQVAQATGSVPQTFAAGSVYIVYTKFFLDAGGSPRYSQLMFSRSVDCGSTWSAPVAVMALDEWKNPNTSLHQGGIVQVDPQAGFIYLAWRRFKTATFPDSILVAASLDRGRTVLPGIPVVTLPPYTPGSPAPSFFDNRQATTATAFRTNAFPTLAVDDSGIRGWPGRLYLSWSQRVVPDGLARIMMVNFPGSLMLTPGGISLKPFLVDNTELVDDAGNHFVRGHQFMPQMTFTGGKLLVLYYDLRLDHTIGTFQPSAQFPDSLGRFFLERRDVVPAPGDPLLAVFNPFIDDANPPLAKRRHTLDVVVAEANPALLPAFTVARVSRYKAGTVPGTTAIRQLQINPPGLPLFKGGTAPFLGDYLDIAGQTFTPKDGGWAFNTAPLKSPVHIATWTSNQDVRPPLDGDWKSYTPAWPAATTLFILPTFAYGIGPNPVPQVAVPKGSTEFRVTIDVSQMTNPLTSYQASFDISFDGGASWQFLVDSTRAGGVQLDANGFPITTARSAAALAQPDNPNRLIRGSLTVSGGLILIGGNGKVVGTGRTSVFDPTHPVPDCAPGREGMRNQNIYSARITEGLVLSAPQNSKPLSATLQRAFVVVLQNLTNFNKSFRLAIANQPAGPGWASFLQTPNTTPLPPLPTPTTTLDVTVAAHAGIARSVFAVSAIASASITVRADEISAPGGALIGGLSSFVVLNPDATVPSLINPEGAPSGSDIASAELYNPDVANPDVANPNASKSAITNPDVANPDVANPDVANPDVANPDVANPDVANVNVMNPDVANPDVANPLVSDATYVATNTGNTSASYTVKLVGTAPDASAHLQLILNKRYRTPVSANCVLSEEAQNTLQANVLKPVIKDPSDLADPDVANPDVANPTLSLAPGETALITLRGNVDVGTMEEIIQKVTPVVVAHAANTGSTTPSFAAPLAIVTATLPDAVLGRDYKAPLRAIGGTPQYSWDFASESNLPTGLELGPDGTISGVVDNANQTGAYPFSIAVFDATGTERVRDLSIRVVQPLGMRTPWHDGFTPLLPTAMVGEPYSAQPEGVAGTPPYSWSQSGLPAGMHLDPATGTITGTPAAPASATVIVVVTDSGQPAQRFPVAFDYLAMRCYPELPKPLVEYLGNHQTPDGGFIEHDLSVTNYPSFPDDLFTSTPRFGACGRNLSPARTWVDIFDASSGVPLNEFCALEVAQDMTRIWFAVSTDSPPPRSVFIRITDRGCPSSLPYTSDPLPIPPP